MAHATRLFRSTLVAVALGCVAPAVARAQGQFATDLSQADLETLLNTPTDVTSATRTPQTQYEAPAIITTVTREQIDVWGHRSIAELLNHLLGFYVVDDHTAPNVAVRGSSGGLYSDSSLIKVLIDGHAVPFASTGGNGLGPELVPLSAVERIEIIRGPASALYGADAFLGVISIITREGATVNGAHGWVAGGVVGKKAASDVDVSLGAASERVDFMLAFRHTEQDLSGLELPATSPAPIIPSYNHGATRARGLDQQSTSAIGRLRLRPSPGTELAAFAYFSHMERGSEFGSLVQLANGFSPDGVFSENRVAQWQLRSGLDLRHQIGDALTLLVRADYFHGGPLQKNRVEVGSDFYYVRRRFGFRGANAEADLVARVTERLRLVGGASLLFDRERLPSRIAIAKQRIGAVNPGEIIDSISVYGARKNFVNVGAYAQGTWDVFGSYLGVTGGLRYDHHNIYGTQISHRLGLVASPLSTLHAKLLHGKAFKAPSPLLLYAVPIASGDVIGNQDLKPQYVDTFEVQLAYTPTDWLDLSSGVAYNRLTDKTEFIFKEINKTARNVASASTISWENLLELRYPQWLHAHVSFELQRTVQRTGQDGYVGNIMSAVGGSYPDYTVHAGVVLQPPGFFLRAAILTSYVGPRWATGNNIFLAGGPYQLPSYFLAEAKLSTTPLRILRDTAQDVSLSVSGKNLTRATAPAPGFSGVDYPLAPRAFFFQINLTI